MGTLTATKPMPESPTTTLSPIEDIIADAQAGRMFILVDDEDRENEGDLIIPASMATAEAINFMAMHGRGLICLALSHARAQQLDLSLMSSNNRTRHQTAFTVSIEAREGVTTGISAHDRARTIAVAIDPACNKDDIVTPGHVFPLIAKDGGVLVRAGHTEAAVDISRLAGLDPAGVICEIMKEDGTMARLPDLLSFAQTHELNVASIADLIAYRRRYDTLVKRTLETDFTSRYGGEFRLMLYTNTIEGIEHIALVKGDIDHDAPVLVRMHALNVLADVLGDTTGDDDALEASMRIIEQEGRGVVVLLREANRSKLAQKLEQRFSPKAPADSSHKEKALRDYGIGAQILLDIGVKDMILLTNSPPQVVALEGYDLNIVGHKQLSET